MADSQHPVSGLVASTAFAIDCCTSLFQKVQKVKFQPGRARDLAKELDALQGVLKGFRRTIGARAENELLDLEIPLVQCGNSCRSFEEEIDRSSKLSGISILEFRDWAHLKYMGETIDAFRRLLTSYKTTIIIALANTDSGKIITRREHYKDLTENVLSDLKDHLENIDQRLNDVHAKNSTQSETFTEENLLTAERLSIYKCCQICVQFSSRLDDIQSILKDKNIRSDCNPDQADCVGPEGDTKSLINMQSKLEGYMKALMNRMLGKFRAADTSREDIEDMIRLQEEWEIICQCLHVCIRRENDLNANVSTISNYATGDAIQLIVSTDGNTIRGENRASGWKTKQVGGHISDACLQHLVKDMAEINLADVGK